LRRIFLSEVDSEIVELTGEQHIHLSVAKRARIGDKVQIAADGYIYSAVVFECKKNSTMLKIESKKEEKCEPNICITLYFARQKPEHSEITVQKAVELGVSKIVPVRTKFCALQALKIDRLNKIAFSAAAQSGRGFVPKVEDEIDFDAALKELGDSDLVVFPYENEKNTSLRKVLDKMIKMDRMHGLKNVAVFVGSEGGFSEDEVDRAVGMGFVPASLGHRILRAETACIAVLACVMYELGEFGV